MKGRTHRAEGGKTVEEGVKVKDSAKGGNWWNNPENIKKEANDPTGFKKGGKVDAFKRGKESEGMKLKMKKKDGGPCDGDKSMDRLDRAKRASGGAVAGSRNPFAMSEKTSERPGFKGLKDIND